MKQTDCRFVLLRFQPLDPSSGGLSFPILLIAQNDAVQVVVQPEAEQKCAPEDRQYLSELIEDWRRARPSEFPVLFEQLSELSMAPLVAQDFGTADERKAAALRGLVLNHSFAPRPDEAST